MSGDAWMGAREAARLLGVSRATLYAYVSRGFVRSQGSAGSTRERRYASEDIERLRRRAEERRAPDKAAARALQWGLPLLESSITLIDGGRLYYRGHDAIELARSRSIAEVADLIWTGQFGASSGAPAVIPRSGPLLQAPFVARAQAMLAAAAANDPQASNLRPDAVAQTGARILRLLTHAAGARQTAGRMPIDEVLAKAWHIPARGVDVVRAALILCADHELNVSSFAARTVASAGSHPYAVVLAGLSALDGPRHGGASARVESMLDALRRQRPLNAALAARLRRGEPIDGFGHPLYGEGDPRAARLLEHLRERAPRSPERQFVADVARAGADITGELPNLDFGLAAVTRTIGLPAGAALTMFAIGRSIGWIGHAIEQYATGQLIRPRAKYVGPAPGTSQR